MKKAFFAALFMCLVLLFMTGCEKSSEAGVGRTEQFEGTVSEVSEGGITVAPDAGSAAANSADLIVVSLKDDTDLCDADGVELSSGFSEGDRVRVVYDAAAGIKETYPAGVDAMAVWLLSSALPVSAGNEGALANSTVLHPEYNAEFPVPDFLTADQQNLFRAAWRLMLFFNFSDSENLDFEDSMTYGPYNWIIYRYNGYGDYDQFVGVVDMVFTDDYADKLISYFGVQKGENGGVYCGDGGVGSNITYIDCSFEQVVVTDTTVEFDLVARYNDDSVFGEGGDPANDYFKEYQILMELTEDGWRFASFALPNGITLLASGEDA